jgi:hypothetical protein
MDNFKVATREGFRYQTAKGSLTTEQLWSLSLTELNDLAVSLDKQYEESGKKSFLVKRSVKDKTTKFKFDIVLDILNTLQEEEEERKQKAEDKLHNEKILALIQDKKEESLKNKSEKELEKMLR